VEVLGEETSFEGLREEWHTLLLNSKASSIFLTHEWLAVYWRFFGAGRKLLVLAARDADDRLVGIAPLCLRMIAPFRLPVLKRAELLGGPFTDVMDLLLSPGREVEVLRAILDSLTRQKVDLIDLAEIPESSPTRSALRLLREERGVDLKEETMGSLPYAPTRGAWLDYLHDRGTSTQRHYKYYTNRLSKRYRVDFAAHRDPDAIEREFQPFLDLYRKRFSEYPALISPVYRSFREEIARHASKNGWMILFVMRLDEELVAAEWCFRWGGALLSYNACYDPDRSNEGITTVFQGNIIRFAFENGFEEYDFLRGEEGYKAHWSSGKRTHYRLRIRRPTLRLSLLEAGREFLGRRIG